MLLRDGGQDQQFREVLALDQAGRGFADGVTQAQGCFIDRLGHNNREMNKS